LKIDELTLGIFFIYKKRKIMVLCNIKNKDIDINFNVEEETVALFDNNKESLIRVLHSYGYKTIKIETKSNSESNILDLISYNANVKYIIDLRV